MLTTNNLNNKIMYRVYVYPRKEEMMSFFHYNEEDLSVEALASAIGSSLSIISLLGWFVRCLRDCISLVPPEWWVELNLNYEQLNESIKEIEQDFTAKLSELSTDKINELKEVLVRFIVLLSTVVQLYSTLSLTNNLFPNTRLELCLKGTGKRIDLRAVAKQLSMLAIVEFKRKLKG
ncbi:MAG: hypothetical protein KatS3mg085_648 [Candidatus Dojkabacteria bacterium]|nr:MAG: hypothetical protein KatS3mg085_648 [Candidatus Dojkabacteria bacterium]